MACTREWKRTGLEVRVVLAARSTACAGYTLPVQLSQLVLWDIDGTLLKCPSKGLDRHELAIQAVRPDIKSNSPRRPGCTDFEVVQDKTRGVQDWSMDEAASALAALEEITRSDLASNPCQRLPGVASSLVWMRGLGWKHALMTGNTRARALNKLESAGLAQEFDWSLSAFGDGAASRAELAEQASATLVGAKVDVAVAIGDTPLDVSAAKSIGLPVVAVASGSFNLAALRGSRPDLAISDLVTGRPRLGAMMCAVAESTARR